MSKKKSEIDELKDQLNGGDMKQKKAGLRKIIDAMTRGKDVSMLFADIVKNSMTTDMELKKLIYLYIINYSKSHPDLAILAINTFRKDSRDKMNPFLRALAIRTMGCIRVRQITEYLLDPLKYALKDEDSYVRKTAVLCVAKFYDSTPDLMEDQGFIKILQSMLNDGNVFVLQNTIVALQSISETKGQNLLELNQSLAAKFLTAISDCQEWGQVYVLDSLAGYTPCDSQETENILERVSACLSHNNTGVVLSCIKVIMKYLDFLESPELVRTYCRKLTAPLVTMMGSEYEIQYVVLKNINLILQKRSMVFDRELKIFFCNFNDPIYIKREKLDILVRLASLENIQSILYELKEYTNEVDIEFVKKSITSIGRCAIKLEKAAEKCVQVLWEFFKQKQSYIIQQTIIVMRDIFRKYPKKYEGILQDLCENLHHLEEPEAKSAMIWIIGEYGEIIENSESLLEQFLENFKEEPSIVQTQVLTASVKLFLQKPNDSQDIVKRVLKMTTEEADNPDLRDRGFIYWRLLQTDPEAAKQIVLSERPVISDQSYTLDSVLLDKLIQEIGTLSSVYYKPPEHFVKTLRDNQNLKEIQEINEQADDCLLQQNDNNFNDNTNNYNNMNQNIPNTNTNQNKQVNLLDDLLDVGSEQPQQTQNTQQQNNLLDNKVSQLYQQQQPQQQQQSQQQSQNVRIPFNNVFQLSQQGVNNKISGVGIQAAVQKIGDNIVLEFKILNQTQSVLNGFQIKINPQNSFNLQPSTFDLGNQQIQQQQTSLLQIQLVCQSPQRQALSYPLRLQVALKTNVDIFTFVVPMSLSCVIVKSPPISPQEYLQLQQQFEKKQESLQTQLDGEEIKRRLQNNGFSLVGVRTNAQKIGQIIQNRNVLSSEVLLVDTIHDPQNKVIRLNITAKDQQMLQLIFQAIGFILN